MDETDRNPDDRELSTGQWRRLRDLFADAVEVPAWERGAYLDRVLAGEPTLRAASDYLLVCEAAADSFLVSHHFGRSRPRS